MSHSKSVVQGKEIDRGYQLVQTYHEFSKAEILRTQPVHIKVCTSATCTDSYGNTSLFSKLMKGMEDSENGFEQRLHQCMSFNTHPFYVSVIHNSHAVNLRLADAQRPSLMKSTKVQTLGAVA